MIAIISRRQFYLVGVWILVSWVAKDPVSGFVAKNPPKVHTRKNANHHSIQTKQNARALPSSPLRLFSANRDGFEKSFFPKWSKTAQRDFAGLLLVVSIAVTSLPLPANAGFGPSSGATTTPPPNLNSIKTTASKASPELAPMDNFDVDLSGKKLKILIDSALNVKRLEEFSGQLDTVIEGLKDSIASITFGDEDETAKYSEENPYIESQREAAKARAEARERELLQAQTLQQEIQRQEKMLLKLQNQPYWFNYFAAFVGAIVSTLVMHPLDTIKTRLQVRGEKGDPDDSMWEDKYSSSQASTPPTPMVLETTLSGGVATAEMVSVVNATATVSTAAGISTMDPSQSKVGASIQASSAEEEMGVFDNLYEGLTGNLFKEVPPSAVYLGVYESVKYALSPLVAPSYLLVVYLIAGAVGETVGSVIRAPAEAVKSLVQSKAKDNALDAAQSVLGTEDGRSNVIRAWSASITRDVPFGAIQLAVFETIKAAILNNPNIEFDSSTLLSEAIIGAFAGGLGAFITNPMDVITTRIITQDPTTTKTDDDDPSMESQGKPLGAIQMAIKIYTEEGPGTFFSGWTARVGYWAPAIGIFLSCYCSVRQAGITYDLFP